MARVSASRAGSSADSPAKPPSPTSESAPEVCISFFYTLLVVLLVDVHS